MTEITAKSPLAGGLQAKPPLTHWPVVFKLRNKK